MLHVHFNTYNNYVTDSLYQWDLNQDLVITGLNLSVAPEIHFANANMNRAIVRSSTLEGGVVTVRIPNSLLQEPLTIRAYVGLYEGEIFRTVEVVEIPVIAKARPFDYTLEVTDEEVYSFKALETKIDNVLDDLTNDVAQFTPRVDITETDSGYELTISDANGTRTTNLLSKGIEETVSVVTMTIAQDAQTGEVDYTPVYEDSRIVLEVVDCHNRELDMCYGRAVDFSILPKYDIDTYTKIESVKRILATRIDSSSAKIDITLKVHEITRGNGAGGGVIQNNARLADVTLLADSWVGDSSPYSQVVSILGITRNSQVDLTPSVEQLAIFYNKDLAFVTENENGVVTVYAIGQKPTNDYTIQATITEVSI